MSELGQMLIQSAKEARAIARGETAPARVHVPSQIDVKTIRKRLGLTQPAFAARFNLNVGRLRDWEQGRSAPDGAVRAYLRVIEREPDAVARALAV
jgi:putative transcriptional regulator